MKSIILIFWVIGALLSIFISMGFLVIWTAIYTGYKTLRYIWRGDSKNVERTY